MTFGIVYDVGGLLRLRVAYCRLSTYYGTVTTTRDRYRRLGYLLSKLTPLDDIRAYQ
jgi:hypothetical protein